MQFFADHCVPRSIGDTLESEGHEVIRLSARLRVDAEDSAVIEEAQKSGAILISLNGDFADLLRYPPEEYGGIVALQVRNRPEAIPSIMDKLVGSGNAEEGKLCLPLLFFVGQRSGLRFPALRTSAITSCA